MLRTINSSLSAYLSVAFNASFFDSFEVVDCDVVQAGLLMKVAAGPVHSPAAAGPAPPVCCRPSTDTFGAFAARAVRLPHPEGRQASL